MSLIRGRVFETLTEGCLVEAIPDLVTVHDSDGRCILLASDPSSCLIWVAKCVEIMYFDM